MNIYNTVIMGLANYNGFANLETRSFKLLISAYISKRKMQSHQLKIVSLPHITEKGVHF